MSSNGDLSCLSGAWLLDLKEDIATLRRPSDGTVIELEGVAPEKLTSLWFALHAPCTPTELQRRFDAFGASGAELLDLFQSEGMLRRLAASPAQLAPGDAGALAELVAWVEQQGTWGLGAIQCFSFADLLLPPKPDTDAVLGLASLGEHLVLVRLGCMYCALLRVLGVIGSPGREQTQDLAGPPTLPPDELRAMLAGVLQDVAREPLAASEGVWVRWMDSLSRGGVLEHPDCPRCRSLEPVDRIEWLRRDLASTQGAATSAERISSALGNSPFSPLRVVEVAGAPGQFPFDQPYVFGDTRLARLDSKRAFCTSIPGIAHGSASSAEQSRMLAWSEGAERLAAQGVRPDLLLGTDDSRARDVYRAFGETPSARGPRAFCRGLDLLRGVECLVPFERVAVGVPEPLVPGGLPSESTFTGCASHVSALDAILHGTVELLKRDAYVVTWYRKRRLPGVRWPRTLPQELAERALYLQRQGIELRLYDLHADLPLPMLLLHARADRRIGNWPAGGSLLVPAGGFTAFAALGHALTLASARFVGLACDDTPERDPLEPDAVERLGRTLPFLARSRPLSRPGASRCLRLPCRWRSHSPGGTGCRSLRPPLRGAAQLARRRWPHVDCRSPARARGDRRGSESDEGHCAAGTSPLDEGRSARPEAPAAESKLVRCERRFLERPTFAALLGAHSVLSEQLYFEHCITFPSNRSLGGSPKGRMLAHDLPDRDRHAAQRSESLRCREPSLFHQGAAIRYAGTPRSPHVRATTPCPRHHCRRSTAR